MVYITILRVLSRQITEVLSGIQARLTRLDWQARYLHVVCAPHTSVAQLRAILPISMSVTLSVYMLTPILILKVIVHSPRCVEQFNSLQAEKSLA